MFGPKPAVSPLAFPVPDPPENTRVRARKPSIPFPPAMWNQGGRARDAAGDPIPWHVPAWLPAGLEVPATFLIGALAGVVFALCMVGVTSLFASPHAPRASSASSNANKVVSLASRQLVIARPITAPERAPIIAAPEQVEPVAAVAQRIATSRPVVTARTTAVRRAVPQPKRDVLSAGLGF